jgi:hypothetical protein
MSSSTNNYNNFCIYKANSCAYNTKTNNISLLLFSQRISAAVEEILNVVKDLNGMPIEFAEAAQTACQNNSQVKYYLDNILRIDKNHRLRDILEIIERDRSVEITDRMPITLRRKVSHQQWQQDLDIGKVSEGSDESDLSDINNPHSSKKDIRDIENDTHAIGSSGVDKHELLEHKRQESVSDRSDRSDSDTINVQDSGTSSGKTYPCPYCNVTQHDLTFSTTDLLVRHVVQRHPGWTAYPGQPDIEKYTRELKDKGRSTDG